MSASSARRSYPTNTAHVSNAHCTFLHAAELSFSHLSLCQMDFVLRCNELKCRTQLHERAVVTTCRYVTRLTSC